MIKKVFVPIYAVLLFITANVFAVGQASNPDPANGETKVMLNKVLSWASGSGAVSHDIYLGTNADDIEAAEYLTGDLDASGQVDYNDLLILTNYWLHNPAGSQPYAGVNDNNIVDFNDFALLAGNWMAKANPLFKGNIISAGYDPNLQVRTTYYWRVDEVNGPQRQKGNIWSFTTADSNYSIIGKVMCGYQGWFNTPSDGTGRNWVHWANNASSFTPTNCHVDMWPDMNDMTAGEKFEATAFLNGNSHYYVFSSHNHDTVMRHFQWMQQYGIDGVYLQRFAKEVIKQSDSSFSNRNDVLDYCKDGANTYGRKYAVMYDLSGIKLGDMVKVKTDWRYLVDTKRVTKDSNDNAYLYHKGKPVVAVWGIGFNDGRAYTLSECLDLVNFLKNDPVYGGCTVMVGVPSNWRTLNGDCVSDPMVHTIILAADIVSPWSVGRYNSSGVSGYTNSVWIPDVAWCNTNSKDYLPVIWPGYSFHNANPAKPFNEMPRNGGQFLWSQVSSTITAAGANMLYVAMFDEVDEATAIFKVTNNPPRPGGADMFLTYEGLPSDEYLWLTGQAGQGLRGEITVTRTRPAR
jgi:hypothetical protein